MVNQGDIDGRRTRQKIYAGEPIIDPKLLARGEVPTDGMIPKGLRVVAITVSPEAILNGLVLPQSRCDVQVFIRADPKAGVAETLCKTVLQDIRVFAVNDVTTTESQDPKAPEKLRSIPTGKTVSLLVTPAQAQIVTLSNQLGSIRLVMRSSEDSEQLKTPDMTARELLGAFGGSDRAKENPDEANEKRFKEWADTIRKSLRENAKADTTGNRPREHEQYKMRVRLGTDVNDVLLTNNSGVQGLPGDEGAWTVTGMGPSSHGKAGPDNRASKPADAGPAGPAAGSKPSADTTGPPAKPDGPKPPGN
jgi:pilus assembly protein CpaB